MVSNCEQCEGSILVQVGDDKIGKSRKLTKNGKFFQFGPAFRGGDHGLELENADKLLPPGRVLFGPPIGSFGFPPLQETPRLRPDKKHYKRPPRDLEQFDHYWLVSERLRDVLVAVDPDGVAFHDCEVFHISGNHVEPKHYLCDVIREVDAIDEEKSTVRVEYEQGVKLYDLSRSTRLILDEGIVGNAHIFRQSHMGGVICDAALRNACLEAGIADPHMFHDLSDY